MCRLEPLDAFSAGAVAVFHLGLTEEGAEGLQGTDIKSKLSFRRPSEMRFDKNTNIWSPRIPSRSPKPSPHGPSHASLRHYVITRSLSSSFPLGVFVLHPLLVETVSLQFSLGLGPGSSGARVDPSAGCFGGGIGVGALGLLLPGRRAGIGGGRHCEAENT